MRPRTSVVDQSSPVSSALITDKAVMVNLQWVNDKSGSTSKLCTILIAQTVGFKNITLNSVQLKAAPEQKQYVQNKDFNVKNPPNSLWVMGDVQIPKHCVYSHTLKTESLKT